jgi:hypothetical protein
MILPYMDLVTLTAMEYQEVVRHCAVSGWARRATGETAMTPLSIYTAKT